MDSPRPSIDSAYSSLFTAGLLNSSTPRSSIDVSRPSSGRRLSPPTPPPKIVIPNIHSSGSSGSGNGSLTSRPKTPSRKRRSTLVLASPQAAIKSPTRAETRSREMHLHVQHNHFSRQHDLQNLHPFSAAALHKPSKSAVKTLNLEKQGMEKDGISVNAWPGFLKGVWTPPAAISRFRRRAHPLAAPSPPPSAPLPKPPVTPGKCDSKVNAASPNKSGRRPPLAPIVIPSPPQKLKSFFVLDDGIDMDDAQTETDDVDMF